MDIVIAILLGIIVLQLGWIRVRIDKVNEQLKKK
jgi:hypothetical protein